MQGSQPSRWRRSTSARPSGGLRYVRPGESGAIDVADAKLLAAVDQPVAEWRERAMMGVPTFQVASVAIKRGAQVIRAERGRSGRFRLVEPLVAPADGPKVESLLAAVSSLRVADGAKGFAADDAKDLSPFGLSPPEATIELDDDPGEGSAAGTPYRQARARQVGPRLRDARAIRMTWSS